MEYRIFQYGVDDCYIKAILERTAPACHGVVGTEAWFVQRFEQNPLGKAVLACAFNGERMEACVAVERFPIQCGGKTLVGGRMCVLFVQDGYAPQDMWSGLLKVLDEECVRQGIVVIFNAKEQGLIAFAKDCGWTFREGMVRYQLNSVTGLWRSIFKLLDLGKTFIADVKRDLSEGVQKETLINVGIPDYYKWLIHTSNNQFVVVDNKEVCAVLVMGLRGKRVREAHIIYFKSKKNVEEAQRNIVEFVKGHFTKNEIDVVSCVDGENYLSKRNSIRTAQKVLYCYKCQRGPIDFQIGEMTQPNLLLP